MNLNENDENDPSVANLRTSVKRPEPSYVHTPLEYGFNKLRRNASMCQATDFQTTPKRSKFKRCMSDTEAIKNAVELSSQDVFLIGDFSKPYALPLVTGRHHDLKSISADVLAAVLRGEYKDLIGSCTIVDCRYPFEFDGGHIIGAKNIYLKEDITKEFLNLSSLTEKADQQMKRHIIVFHCEYSSERGPTLMRFLRNEDRETNKDNYPLLHHPETYILEGGYKAFYEKYKELCEPQNYLPMHAKNHEQELRHFRAKAKSWNGEGKGFGGAGKFTRPFKY